MFFSGLEKNRTNILNPVDLPGILVFLSAYKSTATPAITLTSSLFARHNHPPPRPAPPPPNPSSHPPTAHLHHRHRRSTTAAHPPTPTAPRT
jgi:hypothetical protein